MTDSQIIKLYTNVPEKLQERLLKKYPDVLLNILEVGGWYQYLNKRGVFIYVTDFEDDGYGKYKVKGYGFEEGLWFDNRGKRNFWGYRNSSDWKEIGDDIVESLLKKEGERRGLYDVKPIRGGYHEAFYSPLIEGSRSNYQLYSDYRMVFRDGKWGDER